MRNSPFLILIFLCCLLYNPAQSQVGGPCIDESLIDPNILCLGIYEPVCGCDGITYQNDCVALYYYGVSTWTPGECFTEGPCVDVAGVDFGPCDAILGWAYFNGSCQVISGCSPTGSDGFNYSMYIYPTEAECSIACSNLENCIDPDNIEPNILCTNQYDPVCGCDGQTYTNLCQALFTYGVSSWTYGACPSDDPCVDLEGIDFGPCAAILGWGNVNGDCVEISGCSPMSNGYDFSPYIFATQQKCDEACANIQDCIDPDNIDNTVPCTEQYDPVCGCDGLTYSNLCHALNYGGVTSWTPGECPSGGPCLDLTGLNFGPCEVFLGYGWVNGECVGISGCSTTANNGFNYGAWIFDNPAECEVSCSNIVDCIDPDNINPTVICSPTEDYVCGCDGVTYLNTCAAIFFGGVTSWTAGECPPPPGEECLDLSDIDFGPCEAILGWGYVNGTCQFISGCGPIGNNGFDYSNYIWPSQAECEAACENVLNCIDPDLITNDPCPLNWDPVCGCDGVTYSNLCFALTHGGVTSWTDGECNQGEPCLDVTGIDFGPCDLVLGWAYADGICTEVSGCDYTGSNGFDYSNYFWQTQEECEAACENVENCIDPDLITNDPCPLYYDPVCGCNGVTYGNICEALNHGGVISWTEGPCPEGEGCLDFSDVDFGPCDQFLGYGWVNGQCLSISGCGTIGNNGFDYTNYFFATPEECEAACENVNNCIDPDLVGAGPQCPLLLIPDWVCGCDGESYISACDAIREAGITSWVDGQCDFECVDPDLIQDPPICTQQYQPVCGCDGVTYSNPCYAQQVGGVTAYLDGPCEDADNDGVPDILDCAPFDPNVAPGLPCDDGDASTVGDTYDDCCECRGVNIICDTFDPCLYAIYNQNEGCIVFDMSVDFLSYNGVLYCDDLLFLADVRVSVQSPELGGYLVLNDGTKYPVDGNDSQDLLIVGSYLDFTSIHREVHGEYNGEACATVIPHPSDDQCPQDCVGDVNEDGIVSVGDLLSLLANFGSVCP